MAVMEIEKEGREDEVFSQARIYVWKICHQQSNVVYCNFVWVGAGLESI